MQSSRVASRCTPSPSPSPSLFLLGRAACGVTPARARAQGLLRRHPTTCISARIEDGCCCCVRVCGRGRWKDRREKAFKERKAARAAAAAPAPVAAVAAAAVVAPRPGGPAQPRIAANGKVSALMPAPATEAVSGSAKDSDKHGGSGTIVVSSSKTPPVAVHQKRKNRPQPQWMCVPRCVCVRRRRRRVADTRCGVVVQGVVGSVPR